MKPRALDDGAERITVGRADPTKRKLSAQTPSLGDEENFIASEKRTVSKPEPQRRL